MDWVSLISNIGFPIFSFIACGCALKYEYDHSSEQVSKLTEAVNNNTITLTKLVEKIGNAPDRKGE